MFRQKCLALVTIAILSALSTAQAESLVIENINKANAAAKERPNRGMSMDTVATKWGEPAAKKAAIGEPPISRWEYSTFVVYFEYGNVIHAVTKR